MPVFSVNVVRRGTIDITASELDEATQKAIHLPDSAFIWSERDFEDCYEKDPNDKTLYIE